MKKYQILIIGNPLNKGCHVSENIYTEFERRGYKTKYISVKDLRDENLNDYAKKTKLYPLSKVVKKIGFRPDFIFIDQCKFFWKNDVDIIVFYNHGEFHRPPTVYHPTVGFFCHDGIITYYERIFAPYWISKIQHKHSFYVSVNRNKFKSQKKEYKNIIIIGYREGFKRIYQINELTKMAGIVIIEREYDKLKELGFQCFTAPITDEQYREILPKCEVVWIPFLVREYGTRRMLEAMICKALCIIKIENEAHELILKKMGFKNGEHYIGIDKLEEMKQAFIETTNKKEIIENAYNITLKNHTYKNRVDFIINIYEKIKEK